MRSSRTNMSLRKTHVVALSVATTKLIPINSGEESDQAFELENALRLQSLC